jgi:hypothetical protein
VFTLAVTGEDRTARLFDRPEPKAIFDDPDPVRGLLGMADWVARTNTRVTRLWRVFEQAAAADAEISAEYDDLTTRMRREVLEAVNVLAERGDLRGDRPHRELADLVWLLVLPDQYFRLCQQAGWSLERYTAWLGASMLDLLLGGDRPPR